VSRSAEGLELSDSDNRISLNSREARKWRDLIAAELERLNVRDIERGRIRTVFSSGKDGRWILQWGDEVFVPGSVELSSSGLTEALNRPNSPLAAHIGDFLVLTEYANGGSVGLNEAEILSLRGL